MKYTLTVTYPDGEVEIVAYTDEFWILDFAQSEIAHKPDYVGSRIRIDTATRSVMDYVVEHKPECPYPMYAGEPTGATL